MNSINSLPALHTCILALDIWAICTYNRCALCLGTSGNPAMDRGHGAQEEKPAFVKILRKGQPQILGVSMQNE